MSKNIFIKLLICCIFIHIISTSFLMSTSYALGDIFSDGKAFLEKGNSIDDTINTTEMKSTSDYIYNALLGFAVMVAIIVAMVLGIQFMWASADEKAKVKEALMPFLIGCVVVFGSFTIWKVVVNIGNDAENAIEASSSASKMSDEEIKKIYEELKVFTGPLSEEQQLIIEEYNRRFN